jgi:N-acetylmuramoyl-L-alanine amidase
MSKYTWCLEYGHGGMINNVYQTSGKRSPEWELGTYYEGVGNRDIVNIIYATLKHHSVHAIVPYHTELDIPLRARVNIINELYRHYKNLITVSVHSNAFHKIDQGSGFMGITSVGQTFSDNVAEHYYREMKKIFPDDHFYEDVSDGDIDWEINLALTKSTDSPAILTENLFMTNRKDYKRLMDPKVRQKIALGHVNMIFSMEKMPIITVNELIIPQT